MQNKGYASYKTKDSFYYYQFRSADLEKRLAFIVLLCIIIVNFPSFLINFNYLITFILLLKPIGI